MSTKTNKKDENQTKSVHFVLMRNYSFFLLAIVLGLLFNLIIPYNLIVPQIFKNIGFIMIIIGTFFAYWAQKTTTGDRKGKKNITDDNYFNRGPYKYMRHPTYFGLFIMTLGLSILMSSLYSILFSIIIILILKYKLKYNEEKILEKKYGEVYLNYKNKIKDII